MDSKGVFLVEGSDALLPIKGGVRKGKVVQRLSPGCRGGEGVPGVIILTLSEFLTVSPIWLGVPVPGATAVRLGRNW